MALYEFIDLAGLRAFKEESEAKSNGAYATKMMISQNAETGVVTFRLYASDNTLLDTKTLDLDTEHIIKSVALDYEHKKLVFTMNDDSTIEADISDLIDDLDSKINAVASDLSDEVSRAETAEGTLNTKIEAETTRATGVESGKADKVANGTENDIVLLDANGNIKDSGKSINDVGKVASVSVGGGTPIEPDQDKNIDLPAYPTAESLGVTLRALITETGNKIDLEINSQTFELVAKLYDKNNNLISISTTIDLPIESMVISGYYDSSTKEVVLSLKSGSVVRFSVADLIYGLQSEITASNKLSSDLVSDTGNTNRFVTESEKAQITTNKNNIDLKANQQDLMIHFIPDTWTTKTWNGFSYIIPTGVWADGENVYYSYDDRQYVLDKTSSTWSAKVWNGLTNFRGYNIWTDGENIYYSSSSDQYVLDKTTSTWTAKTWSGLTSFDSKYVWTDGENIYYSDSGTDKQLVNGEWVDKSWSGLSGFDGNDIWTDGENIYCSNSSSHHILNKSTSTWLRKTWNGLTSFSGSRIWTDGENVYYSYLDEQYILDVATSTWSVKSWSGLKPEFRDYIWTDGENIYYTQGETKRLVIPQDKFIAEYIVDLAEQTKDLEEEVENKQDKLESGTNIKTINGQTLLGNGDITMEISKDFGEDGKIELIPQSYLPGEEGYFRLTTYDPDAVYDPNETYYALRNGEYIDATSNVTADNFEKFKNQLNIYRKTILNSQMGFQFNYTDKTSGNQVETYLPADAFAKIATLNNFYTKTEVDNALSGKQDTLISGTTLKTINGNSLLGSGDITISGGGSQLYLHNIALVNSKTADRLYFTLINSNNSSMTIDQIVTQLNNIMGNSIKYFICGGHFKQNDVRCPVLYISYDGEYKFNISYYSSSEGIKGSVVSYFSLVYSVEYDVVTEIN